MHVHTRNRAAPNEATMSAPPERRVRLVDPIVAALAELGSKDFEGDPADERGQGFDVEYRLHASGVTSTPSSRHAYDTSKSVKLAR